MWSRKLYFCSSTWCNWNLPLLLLLFIYKNTSIVYNSQIDDINIRILPLQWSFDATGWVPRHATSQCSLHGRFFSGPSHLLHGCVLDCVCIVVVVDNFKVFDSFSFGGTAEVAVQVGLSCSFGAHSEVSGFVQFNTWSGKHAETVNDLTLSMSLTKQYFISTLWIQLFFSLDSGKIKTCSLFG